MPDWRPRLFAGSRGHGSPSPPTAPQTPSRTDEHQIVPPRGKAGVTEGPQINARWHSRRFTAPQSISQTPAKPAPIKHIPRNSWFLRPRSHRSCGALPIRCLSRVATSEVLIYHTEMLSANVAALCVKFGAAVRRDKTAPSACVETSAGLPWSGRRSRPYGVFPAASLCSVRRPFWHDTELDHVPPHGPDGYRSERSRHRLRSVPSPMCPLEFPMHWCLKCRRRQVRTPCAIPLAVRIPISAGAARCAGSGLSAVTTIH